MFEPCGLSQMIALRYGSLPITRETGGLRYTVLSYNEFTGDGNGFTFLNYNAHDMLHVIERAVRLFQAEPETIEMLATPRHAGRIWLEQIGRGIRRPVCVAVGHGHDQRCRGVRRAGTGGPKTAKRRRRAPRRNPPRRRRRRPPARPPRNLPRAKRRLSATQSKSAAKKARCGET